MQIAQQSRSVLAEQLQICQPITTQQKLLFSKHNESDHSNKNEQDYQSIHTTPPSQNIGTDDSIYQQETNKKKCGICMDNERIMQNLESDLKNERKKNLRYLKIINAKVDKQKQLQKAYGQIAIELKKKMDQATEINQRTYKYKEEKKKDEIIKQLLRKLEQTEKSLIQTVDSLQAQKERNQKLITNFQVKHNNIINNNEDDRSFGKVWNRFYEKQISDLHKKIYDLQFKLYGVDHVSTSTHLFQKPLEQVLTTNSIFRKKGKNSSNISEENSISVNQGNKKHQTEQEKHSLSELFKSLDKIREESDKNKNQEKAGRDQKIMNISKISSIQMKNDQSFGENHIYLQGEGFSQRDSSKTVKQLSQQSFFSIGSESPHKKRQHSLNNELQVVSVNNNQSQYFSIQQQIQKLKENMRKSDKNSMENQSFHLILSNPQIMDEKDATLLSIHHQFEFKLNFENKQCQNLQQSSIISHKQTVQDGQNQIWFQEAIKFIQRTYLFLVKQGNRLRIINQLSFDSLKQTILKQKSFEGVQLNFQKCLETILKTTRKQYERKLNNKQLQLSDIKSKLQNTFSQKGKIQKILHNVQNHNSLLENKVSEVSLQQLQAPTQKTIRQSFLQSIIRKKTSILQTNTRQRQIQCQIFPSNLMELFDSNQKKYEYTLQIISMVPKFLNSLMQKNNFSIQHQLDTKKDLYQQVEQMFNKSSKLLFINEKNILDQSKQLNKQRRPSLSIKQRSQKRQECQKNKDCMHVFQIIQLKQRLKEEKEKIRKLSENNSSSKMQCVGLKKNLEELIKQHQNLKKQVEKNLNTMIAPVKNTLVESVIKKAQSGQTQRQDSFIEYDDNIYFNNVHIEQSSEFGEIKAKLQQCELQLQKWRNQAKKRNKKITYIYN